MSPGGSNSKNSKERNGQKKPTRGMTFQHLMKSSLMKIKELKAHDKLDDNRVKQLMDLVSGDEFGQVFITDTNKDRLEKYFSGNQTEVKIFPIQQELHISKNVELQ